MMKRSWREIEEGLRAQRPEKQMSSSEDFWSDFRARASLRSQQTAMPLPVSHVPVMLRWAAAALVVAAVVWRGMYVFSGDTSGVAPSVESWEVVAPHGAVVIISDEATQATMMLVDLTANGDNDGDSA